MLRNKKTYIAEMLLENHLITPQQLEQAMKVQENSDKKIGEILVDLGFIDENKLVDLLSKQLNVQFIDLKNFPIQSDIVKKLPEFYARHFRAIVLKKEDDDYLVGMVDPQDLIARDDIERVLKSKIKIALVREEDLLSVLDTIFRRAEEISHFAETLSAELQPHKVDLFNEKQDFSSEDMPVVNLLRSIFEDAVQVNASDIHIEPDEKVLRIRLRVDGILQEQIIEEKSISAALVQRIKLISGLNIAEKRLPQDGRFSITIKNKNFDVRVSTIPVQYGESLVMRLLNQSAEPLHLNQLSMPEAVYEKFRQVLLATYGLVLIVGPTGSGKTTTLYAALNDLNSPDDKIITVEDPVEYRIDRINQVQVNPKINLTFASVLRAILRQDPDIIMIGELRDHETVEIAIRAAMTGHFVLGTLHTNDTISAATRLLDMGAEGYLIAGVLRAILAQRLVRQICLYCKENDPLTDQEKIWLKASAPTEYQSIPYKKGKGCTHCHHTGYQGRIGVFELLAISPQLADALRVGSLTQFESLAKQTPAYHPLLHSGLDLAKKGVTSIQEIIRMVGHI